MSTEQLYGDLDGAAGSWVGAHRWPPLRLCTPPLRPPRLVPLTNGTAKRARASECLPSVLRAIAGSLAPSFILATAMAASVSRNDGARPTSTSPGSSPLLVFFLPGQACEGGITTGQPDLCSFLTSPRKLLPAGRRRARGNVHVTTCTPVVTYTRAAYWVTAGSPGPQAPPLALRLGSLDGVGEALVQHTEQPRRRLTCGAPLQQRGDGREAARLDELRLRECLALEQAA